MRRKVRVSLRRADWRLRDIMARRKLSLRALAKRLAELGLPITFVHLSRLRNRRPKLLNMALLDRLCTVLRCTTTDLLPTVPARPRRLARHGDRFPPEVDLE